MKGTVQHYAATAEPRSLLVRRLVAELARANRGNIAEPLPPDLRDLSSVFFAIHLVGGHLGLPIVVATFLISKAANRHPTIINFCIVWILYSIIYCLL